MCRPQVHDRHMLRLVVFTLMAILLSSCGGESLTPRLPAYLGPTVSHDAGPSRGQLSGMSKTQGFGLFLISDTTAPQSAAPIAGPLLTVLENRIREYMESELSVHVTESIPADLFFPQGEMVGLQEWGRTKHIGQAFVVILSSQEEESQTMLGEERMMTQMPGVEVVNSSLAEIALVDLPTGRVKIQARGESVQSMEQLLVPLGNRENSQHSPRDLLRANAAQQALDQALGHFKEKWHQALLS